MRQPSVMRPYVIAESLGQFHDWAGHNGLSPKRFKYISRYYDLQGRLPEIVLLVGTFYRNNQYALIHSQLEYLKTPIFQVGWTLEEQVARFLRNDSVMFPNNILIEILTK